MKELDFLPDWYKQDRQRQSHVRRQCMALGIVVVAMITFNLTATHRVNRTVAEMTRTEDRRILAETTLYEFNQTTKALNELKARTSLIEQMDSRIDIAAILAEMSHLIDESIVLRKVELVAEPFSQATEKDRKSSAPRSAGKTANTSGNVPLGNTRFRVLISGVAARPADAANLVRRLEESSYFQRVHPSYYGNAKVQIGTNSAAGVAPRPDKAAPQASLDVTEFEMACYVANYKELDE